MRNIILSLLISIPIIGCNPKQTSLNSETQKLEEQLAEKEVQIVELQNLIENLQEEISSLNSAQSSNYYRFVENTDEEINVAQILKSGDRKLLDKKDFSDTLDISDNFFVYQHTSKIVQTSKSDFEAIIRDFDQVMSAYGNDFFVRVMTFFNGQSLPLETENSKTDIHILIRPTELGYDNKTFVISDFYEVSLKSLQKKGNGLELIFEHGKFPRKKESISISPELVKFSKR